MATSKNQKQRQRKKKKNGEKENSFLNSRSDISNDESDLFSIEFVSSCQPTHMHSIIPSKEFVKMFALSLSGCQYGRRLIHSLKSFQIHYFLRYFISKCIQFLHWNDKERKKSERIMWTEASLVCTSSALIRWSIWWFLFVLFPRVFNTNLQFVIEEDIWVDRMNQQLVDSSQNYRTLRLK